MIRVRRACAAVRSPCEIPRANPCRLLFTAWMPPAVPGTPEGAIGPNLHRIQVFAFEQTAAKVNLTAPADRNIFHLNNWLHMKENLGNLCGPVAGLQVHVGP